MSIAERLTLAPELRDTTIWETPDELSLAAPDRAAFLRRKRAVCAYLEGTPPAGIYKQFGFTKTQLYRMIERCLESQPDGSMYGFCALVPGTTVASYQRRTAFSSDSAIGRKGYAGLFCQLVTEHPDLYDLIEKKALQHPTRPAGSVAKEIHRKVLRICARFRGPNEYPFAVNKQGRPALASMIRRIRIRHYSPRSAEDLLVADNYGFPMSAQPASQGLLRPYEEVEHDGHNGDFYFVIRMNDPRGGLLYTTPMKLWLVLIIDRASRAILGYAYRLGSTNYPAITVMRSFVHMLIPWQPLPLTLLGLEYKPGAGFPSGVVSGLDGCLPDLVCFDHAKANMAKLTVEGLCETLGVTLNFSRAKVPIARAFVERLNLTLETHGFRRLPGGFNPKGPKKERERALKAAEAHPLELHELEQVLDVMLANYNADPHDGLMGRSPNEYLQQWACTSTTPRRQISDPLAVAHSLTRVEYIRRLRGGQHRAPYVELLDARYSNDLVRMMADSIGKTVRLVAEADGDFRLIRGYLKEGNKQINLGIMKAGPPWHLTPHTLEQRKIILSAKRAGKIVTRPGEDMVQAFKELRQREAKERRSAASLLVRAGNLQTGNFPSEPRADMMRNSSLPWIRIK